MINRNHPGCPCCGGGGGVGHCLCGDGGTPPDELTITFPLGAVIVTYGVFAPISGIFFDGDANCQYWGTATFEVPGVGCPSATVTLEIGFLVTWNEPAFPTPPHWVVHPYARFHPTACFDDCSTIAADATGDFDAIGYCPGATYDDHTCDPPYGSIIMNDPPPYPFDPMTVCTCWELALFPYSSAIVISA